MIRPRRHPGWMLLAIVAGFFVVGVVANAIRAVFAQAYGFLIPATISFFFWYWIAMGAYRRAVRSPEDRRPPPDRPTP